MKVSTRALLRAIPHRLSHSRRSFCTASAATVITEKINEGSDYSDIWPTAANPVTPAQISQLADFISGKRKLVVITGAGCSTESGVPDYRSPNGSYSKGHKPTTFQDFVSKPLTRKRYWARSMTGYSFFSLRQPNSTHTCLATLEKEGKIHHLITQNVDGLHQKAGQQRVIELHGNNHTVVCLSCHHKISRDSFQGMLQQRNPDWASISPSAGMTRPDGDVDLGQVDYTKFLVPDCPKCSGILKLEVVFFGENVPGVLVNKVMDIVSKADGVLAIGTSMQVYSVFRFLKAADQNSVPIAILNIGPTRADELANVKFKVEGRSGLVLPEVVSRIFVNPIT